MCDARNYEGCWKKGKSSRDSFDSIEGGWRFVRSLTLRAQNRELLKEIIQCAVGVCGLSTGGVGMVVVSWGIVVKTWWCHLTTMSTIVIIFPLFHPQGSCSWWTWQTLGCLRVDARNWTWHFSASSSSSARYMSAIKFRKRHGWVSMVTTGSCF